MSQTAENLLSGVIFFDRPYMLCLGLALLKEGSPMAVFVRNRSVALVVVSGLGLLSRARKVVRRITLAAMRIVAGTAPGRFLAERPALVHKLVAFSVCAASTVSVAYGQKTIDSKISGRHEQFQTSFPIKRFWSSSHHEPSYTWKQIGSMIDALEEGVRDDGTVVIKRPDIWSQARMSKYRTEFDAQFKVEGNEFVNLLAGRIARSDQQQFESATAISSFMSSVPDSSRIRVPFLRGPGAGASDEARTKAVNDQLALNKAKTDQLESETALRKAMSEEITARYGANTAAMNFATSLLAEGDLKTAEIKGLFQLLNNDGEAFKDSVSKQLTEGKLGIEPTVFLDEKKRYFDHLAQLKRVNLGDDMADSGGYSLMLSRLPVSIQPGARTLAGHGALLNVTVKPEFGNQFLADTFRSLVVSDIVDIMTPMVYAVLSRSLDEKVRESSNAYTKKLDELFNENSEILDAIKSSADYLQGKYISDVFVRISNRPGNNFVITPQVEKSVLRKLLIEYFSPLSNASQLPKLLQDLELVEVEKAREIVKNNHKAVKNQLEEDIENYKYAMKNAQASFVRKSREAETLEKIFNKKFDLKQVIKSYDPIVREVNSILNGLSSVDSRKSLIVAPVDIDDVFGPNFAIISLAERYRQVDGRKSVSVAELRAFLNKSVQASYDYLVRMDKDHLHRQTNLSDMIPRDTFITDIMNLTQARKYSDISLKYADVAEKVSPNIDAVTRMTSIHSILCWAVLVDTGLLNERIKEEVRRFDGKNGFHAETDIDSLKFYHQPEPAIVQVQDEAGQPIAHDYVTAEKVFTDFVKYRWPVICFALDPVTDQQNIADASTLRRDLQIALSLAVANGQMSVSQYNRFRRVIGQDTETINLNRTVTAYAHGNDTFGWRFYPRFQTPPMEGSNIESFANQMLFGGPPRNYQMKHSKLEAGQRELTVVMIVPSILQELRFEVNSNWFPLHKPDNLTIPNTRMLWQGQQLQEVRQAMNWLCDHNNYRQGDVDRMLVKLDQVEKMLPLQTEIIRVPYENNQSGYELFTPGLSALGPILLGAEGVSEIEKTKLATATVVAFGKNLSLTETEFIVGGKPVATPKVISREIVELTIPADTIISTSKDGKREYLEVRAITPTGISNVIEVPVKAAVEPAKETPKKVSNFTLESGEVTVLVDFDKKSGIINTANVEGGSVEMAVKDSTKRANDKPTKVTALRLDFVSGDSPAFKHVENSPKALFQNGSADISATAVKILQTAIKDKSGILRIKFKDGMSFTVKGAIIVPGYDLTIPLEGEFKVVLRAIPGSPGTSTAQLESSDFEAIHGSSVVLETARGANSIETGKSKAYSDRSTDNSNVSPFSSRTDTQPAESTRAETTPLRFQNLVNGAKSPEASIDPHQKKSELPPALTRPADDLIERQSFVRTQPVMVSQPKSAVLNSVRAGNAGPLPKKSQEASRYSVGQINAAQKTGIPLPR